MDMNKISSGLDDIANTKSASVSSDIVLEGMLSKRGSGGYMMTMQQRYFVAYGPTKNYRVDYFDGLGGVLKGSISLVDYCVKPVKVSDPLRIALVPLGNVESGAGRRIDMIY